MPREWNTPKRECWNAPIHQILKAIGISSSLEPSICPQPILVKQGDVFMLCSDGLNGMVNDRTMEMMVDFQDLSLTATNLVNAALEAGGHDNVTVTLVGIHESSHKKSTFKHFNPIDHKKTQEFPQTSQTQEKYCLLGRNPDCHDLNRRSVAQILLLAQSQQEQRF